MRPVSAAFQDAISSSHLVAVEIRIVQTGETIDTIVDGSVTLDSTSAIRGTVDLTIIDDGTGRWVPTRPDDSLAPYGNQIQVKRGIEFPDGTREMISLGVFRIETVEINDSGVGTEIRVSGLDRAAIVSDAKFDAPGQIVALTAVENAIETIVGDGYPAVEMNIGPALYQLPKIVWEEGADRWELARRVAELSGAELYFDGDGVLVLRGTTIPSNDYVAKIAEGENGVLLSASRRWTREGTFNRVIVTGESMVSGLPVRGDVYDDDANSPTYYFGPFGQVPMFEKSDVVGSTAQAEAAAEGLLAKQRGTFSEVGFGSVVLPHLEPGDVVLVERSEIGVNESHVIDQLEIPLTVEGEMNGRTRGVLVS